MAGVRGPDVLFQPKGAPNNLSVDVEHEVKQWGKDGHSHSWLSIDDLWKVREKYMELNEGKPYRYLDAVLAMMTEQEDEHNTPRLIFFFDN